MFGLAALMLLGTPGIRAFTTQKTVETSLEYQLLEKVPELTRDQVNELLSTPRVDRPLDLIPPDQQDAVEGRA